MSLVSDRMIEVHVSRFRKIQIEKSNSIVSIEVLDHRTDDDSWQSVQNLSIPLGSVSAVAEGLEGMG